MFPKAETTFYVQTIKAILMDYVPFKGNSAVYLSQFLNKYIVPIAITNNYGKGKRPIVRISNPFEVKTDEDLEEANGRLWNLMSNMVEDNKLFN